MFKPFPILLIDGYKTDHRRQYPDGTQFVYSNMTPRKSRIDGQNEVVFFGLQYFLKKYLIDEMNEYFFGQPRQQVLAHYKMRMDSYLGEGMVSVDHIGELHDLGYLPIRIKALPEGTLVPMRLPMLTIVNTDAEFGWLTNQLETVMSCSDWMPCTSATTAYLFRREFNYFNQMTGIPHEFGRFQGHDFSFRGMSSVESAMMSGAAHLTSFVGTDTIPALDFIDYYYPGDNGLVGCSVPATEHSCMCLGGDHAEIATYRRLINEIYPKGIISIVSDTWDFWSIMTIGLSELKDDILARDGKVVIRPDSGDPVKIVCGDPEATEGTPERKGAYQCLWDLFGGEERGGYKFLNPKVGLIYGDAITQERQHKILSLLTAAGFAPEMVLGIGSYSYQYKTRDTFGFAVKATHGIVNGESRDIFKSPKTDSGEKKSLCGRICVKRDHTGYLYAVDKVSAEEEQTGELKPVFEDSKLLKQWSFADVRKALHGDNW